MGPCQETPQPGDGPELLNHYGKTALGPWVSFHAVTENATLEEGGNRVLVYREGMKVLCTHDVLCLETKLPLSKRVGLLG